MDGSATWFVLLGLMDNETVMLDYERVNSSSYFKEQYKLGSNTTISENVAHSFRQRLKPP